MPGINQLLNRQEKWRQERPEGTGGSSFYPREGDIAFFHFLSTGEDDDPFFDVFYSHEIPAKQQGGWPTYRYCPVDSETIPDHDCRDCAEGYKTKKRMAMWLHVYDILRIQTKDGDPQWPTVAYQGRTYFKVEMNKPLFWETSAWRDSCLNDILFLGQQLNGNLQACQMNLITTGQNLTRRYKCFTVVGSAPFDPNVYNADLQLMDGADQVVKPVFDILMAQTARVDTQQMPQAAETYQVGAPAQAPAPTQAPAAPRPAARQAAPTPAYAPSGAPASAQTYSPGSPAQAPAPPPSPAPTPAVRAPARAPAPAQAPLPTAPVAATSAATPKRRGTF